MPASLRHMQSPARPRTWLRPSRRPLPELGQVAGIKQLITLDMGDDKGLSVVIYESEADREAAQPIAQEILGRWADLYAAAPTRQGAEVLINESF